MTGIRGDLLELAHALVADPTLDDADLQRIATGIAAEYRRIAAEHAWAETAHIHAEPHRPVVTLVPFAEGGRSGEREETDASAMVCHDCGRALVSDVGSTRILVCPSLHGRRPAALRPDDPDHAVECGRSR